MLKVKRIYDPPSPDDGKRILVDRLWPRGVRNEKAVLDEWMRDIAPSDELRKWFSHNVSKWQEFKKRYAEELTDKSGLVKRLLDEIEANDITLLFAAKDVEYNNAVALKEIIGRKIKKKHK